MEFLESRKQSFYYLCGLLCLFMGMSLIQRALIKAPLEPWARGFFKELGLKEDPSCRIYQIWVFPFQDGRTIGPIGGKHFSAWKAGIEELAEEAQREPRVRFVYEIYADRHVMEANTELRAEWGQRYGETIRWIEITSFDGIPDRAAKMTQRQCDSGCAAVCSDWVRVWALYRPEYAYNIYLDLDTLAQFSKSEGRLLSREALGGIFTQPGVYTTYYVSGANAYPNNDVLVAYKLEETVYEDLRRDLIAAIESYEPVFEHMATQHIRLEKGNFEEYQNSLEPLMAWASDPNFPSRNMNQYGVLLEQSGPSFWNNQVEKERALPNRYSYLEGIVNDYSWHDRSHTLPYSEYSMEALSACYDPKTAQALLRLNLYLYDYGALRLKEHPWKEQLFLECQVLWSHIALPPQARKAEMRLGELVKRGEKEREITPQFSPEREN